jgi:hypothetical protein
MEKKMKNLKELVENKMLKNCTPHAVNVLLGSTEVVIEPCGEVVRAGQTNGEEIALGVFDTERWEIPVLPEQQEGVFLLVSLAVASAMQFHSIKRNDVLIGGTGPNDNPRRHPVKNFITGISRVKFANR